jgi:hypothetical protein
MNTVTGNSAIIETLSNRIVELEAKIQTAQADKLAAIAIERKRWARADLVALEILRLEQQAKGLIDYVKKIAVDNLKAPWFRDWDLERLYYYGFSINDSGAAIVHIKKLLTQADALKEPKT